MYKLIYLSSATKSFSLQDINDLLKQARDKNSKLNITGMLIYRDGNFIQLLEGDEQAVKNLYSTITKDPRHHSCFVLEEGFEVKRCLADWSMNYRNYNSSPIFTEAELASDETGNLRMLTDFAVNMR